MDLLKLCKLQVVPWFSQSPDLNIIKNMWIDLNRVVHARQPQESHRTRNLLRGRRVKIPQTRTERLLDGYKQHLQTVIAARRGVTKY